MRDDFLVVIDDAEMLVHVQVIVRVIFVVSGCLEDRVKVERVDAQLFEVRQLLLDAADVTAVEPEEHKPSVEALAVSGFPGGGSEPRACPGADGVRVVVGVCVAEAVREDLVPDRFFGPLRRAEDVVFVNTRRIDVRVADTSVGIGKHERVGNLSGALLCGHTVAERDPRFPYCE